MKIARNRSHRPLPAATVWGVLLVAALAAGIWLGQAGAVGLAQRAWEDISGGGPGATVPGSLPALYIDMPFESYDQVLAQRQEALQEGVYLPGADGFVNAGARLGEESVPVRLRLQPGAARHLGDEETWNLQVETRDNQTLLGLSRFNLIDPADNNWLREWAFLASARREGLLAGRYEFVRLFVNGADRGIVAVQEVFGPALGEGQARPPGAIIGYDAGALWETIAYFRGDVEAAVADPATNLTTSDLRFVEVGAPATRDQLEDEALRADGETAVAALRALQRGELAAAEVLDAQRYGRFLALADLWGATGALAPFNLTYYVPPGGGLLQPIAQNGNPLGGAGRVPQEATFQDPAVQAAYVAAAAEFADPAYLADLRAALDDQLVALAGALSLPDEPAAIWEALAARQEQVRLSLQPAQPVLAYLDTPALLGEGIIQIKVANALSLPLEVLGFDIGGATFLEVDPAWIADGRQQVLPGGEGVILQPATAGGPSGLRFVSFNLPMAEIIARDSELAFLGEVEIGVATRLWGLEEAQVTPAGGSLPEAVGDGRS